MKYYSALRKKILLQGKTWTNLENIRPNKIRTSQKINSAYMRYLNEPSSQKVNAEWGCVQHIEKVREKTKLFNGYKILNLQQEIE